MILLLAGTAEARTLAEALHQKGIVVTASLAGATRAPLPLPVPTRIGGFGGEAGFCGWLAQHRPRAVIDATHPFAVQITARTQRICAEAGLPYLRLDRPAWQPEPTDNWHQIDGPEAAAALIPAGAKVFLATGRQSLPSFAALAEGRQLILRVIDRPEVPFPFKNGRYSIGRPPFSAQSERSFLSDLRPDWLIAKNAGGAGGRAKLTAAAQLGIAVALICRPPPVAPMVTSVAAALAWAEALCD